MIKYSSSELTGRVLMELILQQNLLDSVFVVEYNNQVFHIKTLAGVDALGTGIKEVCVITIDPTPAGIIGTVAQSN